jgi:hypothetical protein
MFKRLILAFMTTFIVACGSENPNCNPDKYDFWVDGVPVCLAPKTQQVLPEYVSMAMDFVEQEAQRYYPEVQNVKQIFAAQLEFIYMTPKALADQCIMLEPGIYSCERHLGGVNVERGRRIYVGSWHEDRKPCLSFSSLIHELLHSIEYFYLGDSVGDHETPYFFMQNYSEDEEVRQTIEYRAKDRGFNDFLSCQDKNQ